MLPTPAPSIPTVWSPYIPPDERPITAYEDWQLGGIGLSDPTQGLEVQFWYLQVVVDSSYNGSFWISAPNTPPILLFTRPAATWGRLSFDQNMHPVIAFHDVGGACLYWFDPVISANTFFYFDTTNTVKQPCVSLDDKRLLSTNAGTSDIILTYVRSGDLYYRVQRDRFQIEYSYVINIDQQIANPEVWKVGMNTGYRLQFLIQGNIYQ